MDPKWNLGSKKFFLPFTPHGNIWISVLSASSLAFRLQPVSEERTNSSYSCGCVTDQSSERGKQVCSNFKLISLQTGWLDQRKGLTLGKKTNLLRKHLSSIHGEALQRPQKPENPVGHQDNAEIIFPPHFFPDTVILLPMWRVVFPLRCSLLSGCGKSDSAQCPRPWEQVWWWLSSYTSAEPG